MRKSLRLVLPAAMLFLFVTIPALDPHRVAAAGPGTRTLLQNPDFERGVANHPWMPTGWDTSMADLPTVFFGRDTFLVHGGRWAVNVANMSGAYPMAHNWSQTLLVGPETWGKTAVFRAWTRANGIEGRAYLVIQAFRDSATRMARIWGVDRDDALRRLNLGKLDDPMLDLGWKRVQFDDPLTEWIQREVRTYIPQGTNVLIVRGGLLGTGQVLFDDASLALENAPAPAVPAKGQNLFAEPGFEQHGLHWDVAIPPYEGAKVVIDSTVAHSGRSSIRLADFNEGLIEARIGVGQPFDARPFRGQRVRLAAWVKGDTLQGRFAAKVYAHGMRSGVQQSPPSDMPSGTFDWRLISIEFDVPSDASLLWANLMAYAPVPGTVWIDDASFEVVGPAIGPDAAGRKPEARTKR